jgi:predicted membrane protein
VNNLNPDQEVVLESKIIGKVVLTIPGVGTAMSYLAAHIYIVFVIFGLCMAVSFLLRGILVSSKKKNKQKQTSGHRINAAEPEPKISAYL